MKKMRPCLSLVLMLATFALTGCATVQYFPLEKEGYFDRQEDSKTKTILVMPFEADVQSQLTTYTPLSLLEEQRRLDREYLIKALKDMLVQKYCKVVDVITLEEYQDPVFPEEQKTIIDELFTERAWARDAIYKNLKKEHGQPFEYSLGTRVKEFCALRGVEADMVLFLYAGGYIYNLKAFEKDAANVVMTILSVGTNLLEAVSYDTIYLEIHLVDVETGQLVWVDNVFELGRSFLLERHVRYKMQSLIQRMPPHENNEEDKKDNLENEE